MSTSLLYHAFGTVNYQYIKTVYQDGAIIFHLEKKPEKQRCARCNSKNVIRQGVRQYKIRTVPIGKKPVWLCLHLRQLECRDCQARLQEKREIADPRKSYTRQLKRLVIQLSESMTIADIMRYLGLGWHLIRDIIQHDLEKREKRRSWRNVEYIAIDEIAVRKGHKYMTVVVDLGSGMVLDVVDGRRAESLEGVFRRLKLAKAPLKAIAIDMSVSYRKAIREYAPEIPIVHDPFHVIQNANRALDQIRRSEQAKLVEQGKKVMKGNRFLLLYASEKLKEGTDARVKLEEMLGLNETLCCAYLLKENLRQLWNQNSKEDAESFLDDWIPMNLKKLTTKR